MSGAIPLLSLYAAVAWTGAVLRYLYSRNVCYRSVRFLVFHVKGTTHSEGFVDQGAGQVGGPEMGGGSRRMEKNCIMGSFMICARQIEGRNNRGEG